ncbi:pyocin knob domain-containing protein [Pseudomonas sp. NPDC089401]|uniref:pyocin knob domain-containing protein n=1 Tax=Pseudomonas sp. NPDC089401 TaxID=3364462 RepID=UPI00381F5B63
MPLDQVRLGTPPLGQDGDDPRTAFTRINTNFKNLDDFGFSGPVQRAVTNLDDAIAPGWYSALTGTASSLPPGITKPLLFVATTPAGDIVQRATDVVTGTSAERIFGFAAGAWTAWRVLGTAAAANLTTTATDATLGRVIKVGDFGLGSVRKEMSQTPHGTSQ